MYNLEFKEYKRSSLDGKTYKSDYRYDINNLKTHNTVDILIDELNPDNYYIDYEIK